MRTTSAAGYALPPEIVCDDRERPSGVVDALRERGDVQVCVRRLKCGDYLIGGGMLVERKTFADFALCAGHRPKRLRRRQLFVLQGLPGVGPERAAALLQACGSVAGVFAANEEALADVPGIGPRTAALIHRLVHAPAPDPAAFSARVALGAKEA